MQDLIWSVRHTCNENKESRSLALQNYFGVLGSKSILGLLQGLSFTVLLFPMVLSLYKTDEENEQLGEKNGSVCESFDVRSSLNNSIISTLYLTYFKF